VELDFIDPGKPVQNCFGESFNGTFRNECLNEHWFTDDAIVKVEEWRQNYNQERPHSSLGGLTPVVRRRTCIESGPTEGGTSTGPRLTE